jgi:hypothetical protein
MEDVGNNKAGISDATYMRHGHVEYYFKERSVTLYRVIHKSLRDFRPLRYSSRDSHAEGEHVNRGRDTPSFCHTLQVLDMCTLGDAADVNPVIKFLRHALQRVSKIVPAGSANY